MTEFLETAGQAVAAVPHSKVHKKEQLQVVRRHSDTLCVVCTLAFDAALLVHCTSELLSGFNSKAARTELPAA
jgi:hypothetical protein